MRFATIMDSGDGIDGARRFWVYVVEDDGQGDLVNRHQSGNLPVAFCTQDHRTECAARDEAQAYIAHGLHPT
jgi:hypothetical protein